jgi:hypothetical protein
MSDRPSEPARRAPAESEPGTTMTTRRRNGMGTAALVTGSVSLVLTVLILFAPLAIILGPLAIIFGIVGMRRATRGEADNRGQAVAGIVTGVLSLILVLILGIQITTFVSRNAGDFRRFGTCFREADEDSQFADCLRDFSEELEE